MLTWTYSKVSSGVYLTVYTEFFSRKGYDRDSITFSGKYSFRIHTINYKNYYVQFDSSISGGLLKTDVVDDNFINHNIPIDIKRKFISSLLEYDK